MRLIFLFSRLAIFQTSWLHLASGIWRHGDIVPRAIVIMIHLVIDLKVSTQLPVRLLNSLLNLERYQLLLYLNLNHLFHFESIQRLQLLRRHLYPCEHTCLSRLNKILRFLHSTIISSHCFAIFGLRSFARCGLVTSLLGFLY